MSTVYEATNTALQNRVALKIMSDELAAMPEAVERFIREGIATSRVRHRAIVQVFDAGMDDGTPWISMEILEGESLAEHIESSGLLSPSEVCRIMAEVAGGLEAAHAYGVVHRDLKPHNIFLDASSTPPQPKILDFGIAKIGDSGLAKLTQTGIMMGTPHYMAPEQARGQNDVGPAADFWSLGVIMLEALCGEMPYEAESVAAYLGKLITKPPRDPRSLAPDAPPPLLELIARCLQREPERRPASATELRAELEGLSRDLGGTTTPTGEVSQPTTKSDDREDQAPTIPDDESRTGLGYASAPSSPSLLEPSPARMLSGEKDSSTQAVAQGEKGTVDESKGAAPTRRVVETFVQPTPPDPPKSRNAFVLVALLAGALIVAMSATAGFLIYRAHSEKEPSSTDTAEVASIEMTPEPPSPTTPQQQERRAVLLDSIPRGADITLNSVPLGKRTPTVLMLRTRARVEVAREGYRSKTRIIETNETEVMIRLERVRTESDKQPSSESPSKSSPGKAKLNRWPVYR